MEYRDIESRLIAHVQGLAVANQPAGQTVLRIFNDLAARGRPGGGMIRFEIDTEHRVDLASIAHAPLHPASSVAVLYLAVALLADLNGDSNTFADAIESADRALAWS